MLTVDAQVHFHQAVVVAEPLVIIIDVEAPDHKHTFGCRLYFRFPVVETPSLSNPLLRASLDSSIWSSSLVARRFGDAKFTSVERAGCPLEFAILRCNFYLLLATIAAGIPFHQSWHKLTLL